MLCTSEQEQSKLKNLPAADGEDENFFTFRGKECWLSWQISKANRTPKANCIFFNFGDFKNPNGDEYFYSCSFDMFGFYACRWFEHNLAEHDFTPEEITKVQQHMRKLDPDLFDQLKAVNNNM